CVGSDVTVRPALLSNQNFNFIFRSRYAMLATNWSAIVSRNRLDQSQGYSLHSPMTRSTISRALSAPRAKTEEDRQGTRQHLLEAAGHVFADKGFERSTAKEI